MTRHMRGALPSNSPSRDHPHRTSQYHPQYLAIRVILLTAPRESTHRTSLSPYAIPACPTAILPTVRCNTHRTSSTHRILPLPYHPSHPTILPSLIPPTVPAVP